MIHLVRMLHSINLGIVNEMDSRYVMGRFCTLPFTNRTRYRLIPTFGKDTIRKFSSNTSELKRLAARDYEDLLQVCYNSISHAFPLSHDHVLVRFTSL